MTQLAVMRTHPFRAAVVACLILHVSAGGLGAELRPVLYDDCGSAGRQPHVLSPQNWTFGKDEVEAPLAARTVAFAADRVIARYEGLNASADYAVRVEYVTENWQGRTQRLTVDGYVLHDDLELPRGKAGVREYRIPPEVCDDGVIELSFQHVAGPNAVVSEIWLLSDASMPRTYVSTSSDMNGTLAVRVLDGLQQPVPSVAVRVDGLADINQTAQTASDGVVRFDLADALKGVETGRLSVTVLHGHEPQSVTVPAESVLFRRPVLTPIPDRLASVQRPTIDLCGKWRFAPEPQNNWWLPEFDDSGWPQIDVPGEWVMQGFAVPENEAAGYRIRFAVPQDWQGRVVKIRLEAVYSIAKVYVNGQPLGTHEGGFTPFEVDATEAIRAGADNVLAIAVTSQSTADRLASASQYARHPLGGITREVTVFAAPETHLTRFHAVTGFDEKFQDATLRVMAEVSEPGHSPALRIRLQDPHGRSVPLPRASKGFSDTDSVGISVPVKQPAKWESEHPNLYTLHGELVSDGEVIETISRRIGFRQVEVRGGQLVVNGVPVKLRGVCRHEQDRERGRSTTPQIRRRDVELMKRANINYLRTAHYPPDEHLLDLCDEFGIFVQEEAPWCWVRSAEANSAQTLGLMLRSHAEMMERDLSHACIIIWDLANESRWGENYRRILEYTRQQDPSRPTLFSYQPDSAPTDVITWHYPGPGGPARTAQSAKPVTFDEYCHLNCYNPAEVMLDPGLRDYWGKALDPMWSSMYSADNCLGGAIWCWADDVFDIPGQGAVGYGEWGPIDGWQREKPEWWHVRKAYSPVHIRIDHLQPNARPPLLVPIQNRFNFTNLDELDCRWEFGEDTGDLAPDIPPRSSGELSIPVQAAAGDTLHLRFADAGGRRIDEYRLPVGERAIKHPDPGGPCPELRESGDEYVVEATDTVLRVSRDTGSVQASVRGRTILTGGPWIAASRRGTADDAFADGPTFGAQFVSAEPNEGSIRIQIQKNLSFGKVRYSLNVHGDGTIVTEYDLAYTGAKADVREIGLIWRLPSEYSELRWRRRGQWSVYPEDHIGRLDGVAHAFPPPPAGGERPENWALDPDPGGCNDFRSSKYNVVTAALTDGSVGLTVLSDASAHVRATMNEAGVLLRVNNFANGGGERFLRSHYASEVRLIQPGDTISGSVRLALTHE